MDDRSRREQPHGKPGDEADLRDLLARQEVRAPDDVVEKALRRITHVRQRPGWLARLASPVLDPRAALRVGVLVAAAVLAVVVGIQASSVLVGSATPNPSASASAAPTTGPSAAPSDGAPALLERAVDRFATGRLDNSAVGIAFGSVWVGALDVGIVRMDPSDGAVQATIELAGEGCGALQASQRSIWFQSCGRGPGVGRHLAQTMRIDPARNRAANAYDDGNPDGIGIGQVGDTVWFISDTVAGVITGVEDASGAIVDEIRLDVGISHLTAHDGSLWLALSDETELWRVDPSVGAQLAAVPLTSIPNDMAVAAGALWVALPETGQLVRVDPLRGQVVATFEVARLVEQVVVGQGLVWAVANTEMVAIDPDTGMEVARYRIPAHRMYGAPRTVFGVGFDSLWWATRTELLRIPEPQAESR